MANIEFWFTKNIPRAQNVECIKQIQVFSRQFLPEVLTRNHSSFIQAVPNKSYGLGFCKALNRHSCTLYNYSINGN